MWIIIKELTGKSFIVEANPENTIEDLRHIVEEKTHIPVDQQRFIFAGRDCQYKNTLESYGVQNYSTIHIILRKRGV